MCSVDPYDDGRWISACLMYRGSDCKPDTCHKAVTKVRELYNMKFIDWIPTGVTFSVLAFE